MNETLKLESPAKINLALDVLKKDEITGYHLIQTVFQRVNIFDLIEFTQQDDGFILDSSVELPPDNTVTKAYHSICDHAGQKFGLKISLKKRIPSGAGLGGASSNAATILVGMNHLFSLNIGTPRLMEMGARIGKDVPFFVSNASTALGSHFGEKITALPAFPDTKLLIIFPRIERATPQGYASLDLAQTGKQCHKTDMMIDLLRRGNFSHARFLDLIHNDFEPSFFVHFPKLMNLKEDLQKLGTTKVTLTGSGSSLVCFGTQELLLHLSEKLRRKYKVFMASTY